jgi:hypothetical protein
VIGDLLKGGATGLFEQAPQRLEGRPVDSAAGFAAHQRARDAVEHPLRNVETLAALLLSGNAAAESTPLGGTDLSLDQQFLTKEGVPRILDPAKMGIVGSVLPSCTTRNDPTRPWATSRRVNIGSS